MATKGILALHRFGILLGQTTALKNAFIIGIKRAFQMVDCLALTIILKYSILFNVPPACTLPIENGLKLVSQWSVTN